MLKIMFVCHGNICRSPMAEFVLKDMLEKRGKLSDFVIASAATSTEEIGNGIHRGTRKKLSECGIPVFERQASQLEKSDYTQYDYFIGMDKHNVVNMLLIFDGDPQHKVSRLLDVSLAPRDIADPWYTGNFDQTYSDVVEGCAALLQSLEP